MTEKVSALKTEAFFRERAERANPEMTSSILDTIRKFPPTSGDELPKLNFANPAASGHVLKLLAWHHAFPSETLCNTSRN